ncbi:MAG: hypothetical protein A2660_02955 [Candidatus Doudnabacteria bacterium RIFCSPHIGHO2_01_FULL_45_18]|uniref:DUF304 domain-containing protein n=1 Tax=Candidatus Doudnabacteria bacterium RIFCSPHIGHO2_01_FULL_45_18 TaxID=1817823 RepID=A0A1F5NQY1_9BACT|nr:MAG: hypothetical protein A2660_02955 [Candidatus Doudnabacteria bacterium RIFCSPHIGHO2_01_FULL_45_18]
MQLGSNPHNLFPGQQENEEVLLITRPHWMVFLGKIIFWMIFVGILFLADWAIANYAPILNTEPHVNWINLLKNIYLMFLILGLLILWVMYYLNLQIITNERVVDVTQTSLLHHTVSELHLSNIEDVTAETKGLLGTFLDYGNVYVQTAAETTRFVFDRVPNPAAVEKLILDLYEALPPDQKGE